MQVTGATGDMGTTGQRIGGEVRGTGARTASYQHHSCRPRAREIL